MNKQFVPLEPTGCFLDYTYCSSEKCTNECGRKMSDKIKEAINKIPYHPVAFSYFCENKI